MNEFFLPGNYIIRIIIYASIIFYYILSHYIHLAYIIAIILRRYEKRLPQVRRRPIERGLRVNNDKYRAIESFSWMK